MTDQSDKGKRKTIPKIIKNEVWDNYIGKTNGLGKCYVCATEIDSKNFEVAHIIAVKNGGSDESDNLRPTCLQCNRSMGVQNLEDFKKQYFEKKIMEDNHNIPFLESYFVTKKDFRQLEKKIDGVIKKFNLMDLDDMK